MLFNEIYGAYYNAVAAILRSAIDHNVTSAEINEITSKYAFGESITNIPKSLKNGDWSLIHSDGSTNIKNPPSMPLTILQKRWLKAISLDSRIRLFGDDIFSQLDFPDVEPLFRPEDIVFYDMYSDGDNYEDENYISHFRTILQAIKNGDNLIIEAPNRKNTITTHTVTPDHLEYSEKDDKFRLMCKGAGSPVYNLAKIVSCTLTKGGECVADDKNSDTTRQVVFELVDERKSLDRILMHFAHFSKEVVRTTDNRYEVKLSYDSADETEIVIRMLSFGPNIEVKSPARFRQLIVRRLQQQIDLNQ